MKIIIDGNSIFYKLYFGMKDIEATNKVGVQTGAIYGFLRYLNGLKREYGVTNNDFHITFDNKTSKDSRLALLPEYKGSRLKTDTALFTQLAYLIEILRNEGIKCHSLLNLEADDLCFQLALEYKNKSIETLVISRDKDLLLSLYVGNNSKVLLDQGMRKGVKMSKLYTREVFKEVYGFSYSHFLDFKTITGDNSDNIKGIEGVGVKGATDFLKELDQKKLTVPGLLEKLKIKDSQDFSKEATKEKLFKELEILEISKKSLKILNKILEQRDNFELYKKIMTPKTGYLIPGIFENLSCNYEKADQIYEYLEIKKNKLFRD